MPTVCVLLMHSYSHDLTIILVLPLAMSVETVGLVNPLITIKLNPTIIAVRLLLTTYPQIQMSILVHHAMIQCY